MVFFSLFLTFASVYECAHKNNNGFLFRSQITNVEYHTF